MRLQPGDVIFGFKSKPFDGINDFLELLEECDEEQGVILTLWRDELIYNLIAYGR